MTKILSAFLFGLFLSAQAFAQAPPTPGPTPIVCPGGTTTLAVTTVTATAPLALTSASCRVVTFLNDGTAEAFVALGDNTVVATTSSTPIPAGASWYTYAPVTFTNFAAITATGSTTLRAIQANGPVTISGGGNGTSGGAIVVTTAAITPVVSTALENNHVLKGSANGTLYSVYASNLTGGAVGYLQIYNAITAPADGASQTPVVCVPFIGGVASANYQGLPPSAFATGITAVISSATSCFTKTTGVLTGFISGIVK